MPRCNARNRFPVEPSSRCLLGAVMAIVARRHRHAPAPRRLVRSSCCRCWSRRRSMALAFLHLAGPPRRSSTRWARAGAGSANPLLGRDGIMLVLGLHHAPARLCGHDARACTRIPASPRRGGAASTARCRRAIVHRSSCCRCCARISSARRCSPSSPGIGNFGIPALLGAPANYLTLPRSSIAACRASAPASSPTSAALGLLVAAIAGICVAASQRLIRRREPCISRRGRAAAAVLAARRAVRCAAETSRRSRDRS